jgi:BirA family transcriptional regulator, biotin operon repressor / biotin---[acetyl-CoA-carboxylase] ligase
MSMGATQQDRRSLDAGRTPDRLDADAIAGGLRTEALGLKVKVFESTASTNSIAAEYARNPDNHGLAVFAELQTAGRGRGGHRWFSARGDSLLVSIVLTRCDLRPELLSLTVAVAAAEAIGPGARIKWPNDVLLSGRKVAGILVETKAFGTHKACVVGVGINCHQRAEGFPPDLRTAATSLDLETGTVVDRNVLARRLLTILEGWLAVARQEPGRAVERWGQLSAQVGGWITVVSDGARCSGTCLGVDPERGLILQLDRGGVRVFDASHSHLVSEVQPRDRRDESTAG